jgi:hypothetical protein
MLTAGRSVPLATTMAPVDCAHPAEDTDQPSRASRQPR